jgi:hypothetical protein
MTNTFITLQDAVALQVVLGAAQRTDRVRRIVDGQEYVGTAFRVVVPNGDGNVVNGELEVVVDGVVTLWPIRELMDETTTGAFHLAEVT